MPNLANITLCGLGLLALSPLLRPERQVELDPPQSIGSALGIDEVCATGCAAVPALDLELSQSEFSGLIASFASEPMGGGSEALEQLLFHGAAARAWIDFLGSDALAALDAEREAFLRSELARDVALLSVRVTDVDGTERFSLDRVEVPLAEKQHLHANNAVDVQVPEISGTVQRVGVNHLWTRL